MPRQNVEAFIRDCLAGQLDFIEPGLVLIEDEYHLRNPNGASGFVDLFAKDDNGNLVVIELKRSAAAEREAITELAKYAALVRATKNIKPSELRLIVISTDWRELRVPFSEFFHNTSYQLEGYLLTIDLDNKPIHIERVHPLPRIEGRRLCRRHFVRYYKTTDALLQAQEVLVEESRKVGIEDFVVVHLGLNFEDPYHRTNCALYYAQQLKPRAFYEEIVRDTCDQDRQEELADWVSDLDEEDAVDELADASIENLTVPSEWVEIGHPEKFNTRVNIENKWELRHIARYGLFAMDERLTDEHLIADLSGTTGTSFIYYFASFQLQNRAKLEEVINEISTPLFHNDTWRHAIEDILRYANRKRATSITLSIFNKDDILETIWMSRKVRVSSFEPRFLLVVEYVDSNMVEIFDGAIKWDPENTHDLNSVLAKYFDNQFGNYLFARHFGEQRGLDAAIMNHLGLSYTVDYVSHVDEKVAEVKNAMIRGNSIQSEERVGLIGFSEYIERAPTVVDEVVIIFDQHHMAAGVFDYSNKNDR